MFFTPNIRGETKRESGENPERARHCDYGVFLLGMIRPLEYFFREGKERR